MAVVPFNPNRPPPGPKIDPSFLMMAAAQMRQEGLFDRPEYGPQDESKDVLKGMVAPKPEVAKAKGMKDYIEKNRDIEEDPEFPKSVDQESEPGARVIDPQLGVNSRRSVRRI